MPYENGGDFVWEKDEEIPKMKMVCIVHVRVCLCVLTFNAFVTLVDNRLWPNSVAYCVHLSHRHILLNITPRTQYKLLIHWIYRTINATKL